MSYAAGDGDGAAVWTTAEHLPLGGWVSGGDLHGGGDLRASFSAKHFALQREQSSLTACSSYWSSLPPAPAPVPRNFSWTTSAEECGIAAAPESKARATRPLPDGMAPTPARAFASRGALRGIRVRDAQDAARRTKVDAFMMASRGDARLNTTFSSCSEIAGGSGFHAAPQRRGSSPGIFSSVEGLQNQRARGRGIVQLHHEPSVRSLATVVDASDDGAGRSALAAAEAEQRPRPAAARMSPQFRAYQKWSDRNSRSTSGVAPGLPKTPELARARGKRVAKRAKEKMLLASERRGVGSRLWKARTGALKGVRILLLEHSGVTDHKAEFLGAEMAFVDPNAGGAVHVLLAENWIGQAGAKAIAKGLAASNCTHRLNLSQNRIGGAGGGHFRSLITETSVLKSLDLSDNPLGLASFEALGEALASRAALKVLRLDGTGAGMGGALEAMANALVSPDCTLRSLSLRKNNIRGLGACVLADAIAANTCLHSLELGYNNISEAALADGSAGSATRYGLALQENTTLRSLGLGHNDIGDVGAVQLATALEHTVSLQKLVLSNNLHITSEGCASFIKAKQMGWVDDIVITSSEGGAGSDSGGDGLDALVEGGTAKETSRSAAVRAKKAASIAATAMLQAGKAPLTVELVGCFTKGNIPASLLIELGML